MSKQQSENGHVGHSNGKVTVLQDPNDPDSVIIRTRKRERRRRRSGSKRKMNPALKGLLVVLGVFAGVGLAVGIALAVAVHMGNLNLHKLIDDGSAISEAADKASDNGQVVEYEGHTYVYNPNVVSFVLIGHDDEKLEGYEGKSLADTIVLFTMDTTTNKIRATVVPRNTWCAVDLFDDDGNYTTTRDMQITLSHGVSLPTPGLCAGNTVHSVSRIMYDMPMEYYVDFGGEVVGEASSAIGGVELMALETIPGTSIVEGQMCLLEGESAIKYVTYRDQDKLESALDRQERQIQFMRAFAQKVFGMGVPGIMDVYNIVSRNIVTNLGISEIAYLASCFVTGDNAQIDITSLEGKTEVGREADGIEYERYMLDQDSVMRNTLASYYKRTD